MHLVQGSSPMILSKFTMQKELDKLRLQCHILFVHLLKCGMKVELSIKIEFVVLPFIFGDQSSPWMSFLSIF